MAVNNIIIGQQRGLTADGENYVVPIGGSAFLSLDPLPANGTVDTGWIAYTGYVNYMYCISSDVAGAPSGVKIDYSDNEVDIIRTGNVTGYANPPLLLRVAVTPISKFFRITYTNGAVPQTAFYFELVLTTAAIQGSTASVFQPINRGNLSTLVKNIPELNDGNNAYAPIQRVADAMKVYVANQPTPIDVSSLATSANIATLASQLLEALNTGQNVSGTVAVANTDYAKESGGNLAAIASKDFASQTTLAAILDKIVSAPSTEAKQDAANALLVNLTNKDYATQTTLAAVLNKLIAAPATEAKQDTGNASLFTISNKDFATQTTLSAVLSKITSDPATQTTLAAVLAKLNSSIAVTGTFWQAIQPVSGTVTANTGLSQPLTDAQLRATAVPVSGSFYQATQPISAVSLPLATGASTSANQALEVAALGSISDAPSSNPSSSASIISLLKGLLQENIAAGTLGTAQDFTLVANVAQTILADSNRKGLIISSSSGTILIGVGFAATATRWSYRIVTNGVMDVPEHWAGLSVSLFSTTVATATATLIT